MMEKQNVIVFFTDQQRADAAGSYGNPCGLTPNFDQMARRGTFAEYAFTPQPVCGPARGVLQTGKYATTIGIYRNKIRLSEEHKTLANYFNDAGYHTGYIGKWHLSTNTLAVAKEDRGGYQYWLGANSLEASSTVYDTVVYDNDNNEVKLPGYRVDALTDAAIRYIDHHQKEPFFLFLSFLEPHFQNPHDSFPPPDVDRNTAYNFMPPDLGALGGTSWQHLPGYYGMVKRLDTALGRIQDALKSLGLSDNTIVLFTSDHGCHFKTRNKEYKRSCHDSSIRIPMAFDGGCFSGGGSLQGMVSLVDVPPTLLDACKIPIPEDMQGHSILPLMRDKKQADWPEEVFVQISESQVGRCVRTKRWKYSVEALDKNPTQDSGSEVYTETFLYDLEHDPYELNNLIGLKSHQKVAEVMAERLKARMAQAGEAVPQIIHSMEARISRLEVFPGEEYM
jgi:arylsulfatase A-like enzyme